MCFDTLKFREEILQNQSFPNILPALGYFLQPNLHFENTYKWYLNLVENIAEVTISTYLHLIANYIESRNHHWRLWLQQIAKKRGHHCKVCLRFSKFFWMGIVTFKLMPPFEVNTLVKAFYSDKFKELWGRSATIATAKVKKFSFFLKNKQHFYPFQCIYVSHNKFSVSRLFYKKCFII